MGKPPQQLVATVVADVLENGTTAYLAWSYARTESDVVWFALACTVTKVLLFTASAIVVLIGGLRGLRVGPSTY